MGILTGHWSATPPNRQNDYHLEFGQKLTPLPPSLLASARAAQHASEVPWDALIDAFNVWKNHNFSDALAYGTWHWNHDFRDGSPNIEIAALCMGGPHVGTTNWGQWPYTKAHAWMHAYLFAVVCSLKNIHPLEMFDPIEGYFDGPLYSVSTHGERAYQTDNAPIDAERGYGAYSKDPNMRWDLDVLDEQDILQLANYDSARAATGASAAWLRQAAADIQQLPDFKDHWNLGKSV